ncbi:uncharacterized protein (TIGR02246 family) [Rhodococcus sp. 27YEA15]|uniref:YybH family protein n=1 Tax=Rhodococcus sp. 27YEA15 TaxID=3156259 RepID=UPI003C7AF239
MPSSQTTSEPNSSTYSVILAIVTDVQNGFDNNDAQRMNAHLADDAVVVTARGTVLSGRPDIERATEESFESGFSSDATAYYQVTDVFLLAPDVISARKNAWSTRASAEAGSPPEMNALYIFVRRSNRWLIWRRQNTLVA